MKYQNTLKLTKSERIFVFAAVILGVALDGLSGKYIMYMMPIGKDMAITWGILRIIGNIMKAAVFAFIVLRMIKVFRQSDFTLKRVLLIVASVVLVLALVAFNIWRYTAVKDFNQYLVSANADINKSIISKMNQDLPPEKKSRLSYLHAQAVFREDGHLIEYLSPEGSAIPYSPSDEDQSARDIVLFQQTYSGLEKMIATTNSLLWLIALLGVFTIGFSTKVKKAA